MEIVFYPHRTGKTFEVVCESAETGKRILARSVKDVQRIKDLAAKMGLEIPDPITVDELMELIERKEGEE